MTHGLVFKVQLGKEEETRMQVGRGYSRKEGSLAMTAPGVLYLKRSPPLLKQV
jgi:hypothetical protein